MVVGDPGEDEAVLIEKRGKWPCLSCFARSSCRHVKAAKGIEEVALKCSLVNAVIK